MSDRLSHELVEMIVRASGRLLLACILNIQCRISSPLRQSLSLACSPNDIRQLFHSGYVKDAESVIRAHIDRGGRVLTTRQRSEWRKTLDCAISNGVNNSLLLKLCKFNRIGVTQVSLMIAAETGRMDTLRALFHSPYWYYGSWFISFDDTDPPSDGLKYFSHPLSKIIWESEDAHTIAWMQKQMQSRRAWAWEIYD